MQGRWLGLISFCAYFFGFVVMFCAGNGKHLSKRMIELMAISYVMDIPPFGVEIPVIKTITWCCGILVFQWLFYEFYKEGCLLRRTYNPQLDNLYFSLPIFFSIAAAVPILMIFFLPDGLFGCKTENYKSAGFNQLQCIYDAVHTTSYCLFPLSFLPQLWIMHKLRSRENTRPTRNIRFFFFCMMIYAGAYIVLFAVYQYDMWQVGVVTHGVAFVLITHRWLIPCCCGKKDLKDADEDEDDPNNAAGGGANGGVDVELPTTAVEDYGNTTNGGGWNSNGTGQKANTWDDDWLKDDK